MEDEMGEPTGFFHPGADLNDKDSENTAWEVNNYPAAEEQYASLSPGKMKRKRSGDTSDRDLALLDTLDFVVKRHQALKENGNPLNTDELPHENATLEHLEYLTGFTKKDCESTESQHADDDTIVDALQLHRMPTPGLLSNILYDTSRVIQKQTSAYNAFQLLYGAVERVKQKENAINYIKQRAAQKTNPRTLYQKLMVRRMDKKIKDSDIIFDQYARLMKRLTRVANIWGHHCCMDEIDDNKPYNEPPQIKCIKFDQTGEVIITGGDEGIIKLWHAFNCTLITSLQKHAGGIMCLDVHPNNYFIVSCCDGGELWLWEINGNLHRPHKKIVIPFKYLWCRFLCAPSKRVPTSFTQRCEEEIRNTLVVSVSANSKMNIYRMSDMISSSCGSNIVADVAPLYSVELFNHNIKAYDISGMWHNNDSCLIALGIEPMFLEELRLSDDATSFAISLLQKEQMLPSKKRVRGKYGEITSSALCALFSVSTDERASIAKQEEGSQTTAADSEPEITEETQSTCLCDIDISLIRDATGTCTSCFKKIRRLYIPPFKSSSLDSNLKDKTEESEDVETSGSTSSNPKKRVVRFNWNYFATDMERYLHRVLSSYDLQDDIRIIEPSELEPTSIQAGRLTSTLVFPSYIDRPWVAEEPTEVEEGDPGDFDDLLYHLQLGHETSPDVCFANLSLDHVTASDDGKLFLWKQWGDSMKFRSTTLYTKCLERWLNKKENLPDGKPKLPDIIDEAYLISSSTTNVECECSQLNRDTGARTEQDAGVAAIDSEDPEIQLGNQTSVIFPSIEHSDDTLYDTNHINAENGPVCSDTAPVNSRPQYSISCYMTRPKEPPNLLIEPDAFVIDQPLNPSMVEAEENLYEKKGSGLFKEEEAARSWKPNEGGHLYVITDIAWSKTDCYIFIADSLVTKYNVKKIITSARTITSGVSVFTTDGTRVADFLQSEITHHVGCVRPHPVTDDIGLAITYGGLIYIFSVSTQAILKKLDYGLNAVWLDAAWHPRGNCFVACQLFGCFSMFSTEDMMENYKNTLNHQCGYSDVLTINTTAFYSGPEDETAEVRRYYHGSMLVPPVVVEGMRCDESLRLYTMNAVNTIMDENKSEVLMVTSNVPMQVDDTSIWNNRILEMPDLPKGLITDIRIVSRIPLPIGVIEFLQCHISTYGKGDISLLFSWFLVINRLDSLVEKHNREKLRECPYGGISCSTCLHITKEEERVRSYEQICAGFRGAMSKVNDRGDIISCLPIAARPVVSSSNSGSNSTDRRPVASPGNRVGTSSSSNRGSQYRPQNLRSTSGSRSQSNSRSQPLRTQPQRGNNHLTRPALPSSTPERRTTQNVTAGTPQHTPTRTMMITRATERHNDSVITETITPASVESISQVPNEAEQNSSAVLTQYIVGQSTPTQSDGRMPGSSELTLMAPPVSDPQEAADRARMAKDSNINHINLIPQVEQARNLSCRIGPLTLNLKLRREHNVTDIACAICGFITETSRNQRAPSKKVWIGGSKLLKNSMVGPFIPSKRYMEALEAEFPKIYERIQSSFYFHIGCIAAATYIEVDNKNKSILNFPEVMMRGLLSNCAYCKGNFATVCCSTPECPRAFHYPCAVLCFEDEAYGRRQPTSRLNPSFIDKLDNLPDPLMCDNFLCLDCCLKSWVDGSFSMEPFCSGTIYQTIEARRWFYDDSYKENWPIYVPQGGDLIVVQMGREHRLKANNAALWTHLTNNPIMEVKKVDYRFYGPIDEKFGVCTVMSMRQVDGMRLQSVYYYPGILEVYSLLDIMIGLWRVTQIATGETIKVKGKNGYREAVVKKVEMPCVSAEDLGIADRDYSLGNIAIIAQAAVGMCFNCIEVEPHPDEPEKSLFSTLEIKTLRNEEHVIIEKIKNKMFTSAAREKLLNLTLDPAFEAFNTIQSYEETTEQWVKTYWRIVPNPMHLEKIRERILSTYYNSPQGVFMDLEMVVQNCRFFNPPGSEICKELLVLEQAIATVKEDIRRSACADKYGKAIMEFVWPAVDHLFRKPNGSKATARHRLRKRAADSMDEREHKTRGRKARRMPEPTVITPKKADTSRENRRLKREMLKTKQQHEGDTSTSQGGRSSYLSRTANADVPLLEPGSSWLAHGDLMYDIDGGSVSRSDSRHVAKTGYGSDNSASSVLVPAVEDYSFSPDEVEINGNIIIPRSRRKSPRVAELSKRAAERKLQIERERREQERVEREKR